MQRLRLFAVSLALMPLLLAGCQLHPERDDAGDASFVRQVVPLLLGRPLGSADEGQLLVDLIALYDRATVVRMLTREPEFRAHWTNVIAQQVELQREGSRALSAGCFGDPLRVGPEGDGGALAAWVRDHDLRDPFPGTAGVIGDGADDTGLFNFADLVLSALELDDLSVVYKAYLVPLVTFDGNFEETVGQFFMRTYLNKDLDCTMCHNREGSYSDPPHTDYQRTFPLSVNLDAPVLGCDNCGAAATKSKLYGIFRRDIPAGTGEAGDTRPWGMARECGTLEGSVLFVGIDAIPAQIAGIDTEHGGYPELVARFDLGVRRIAQHGTPARGSKPPPERALAYMVAASAVEKVWESAMHSRLTLSHGYARNGDQMQLLQLLTEKLLDSHWSLSELLVEITTSGHFNRDTPEQGNGDTPYRLPPVFDPFSVPIDDPEIPDEEPCPTMPQHQSASCSNGQGEIVTRFTPVELLTHVHHALGWPAPARFPSDAYPSLELMSSMDAYLSDGRPGSRDWGFQSLIAWEDAAGRCQAPDEGEDWIDLLLEAIPAYDAEHPGQPARLRDVVAALKQRLVQTTAIDTGPPIDDWAVVPSDGPSTPTPPIDDYVGFGEPETFDDFANAGGGDGGGGGIVPIGGKTTPLPPGTPAHEREGLEQLFNALLTKPAADIAFLEDKTRRLCGALLRSPQKVMKGVAPRDAFDAPRLRVCVEPGRFGDDDPGEPCGYLGTCLHYSGVLASQGRYVDCLGPDGVSEPLDLKIHQPPTPPESPPPVYSAPFPVPTHPLPGPRSPEPVVQLGGFRAAKGG